MLDTLRTILQEVNRAESLTQALDIVVKRVRQSMQAGVCSIYIRNQAAQTYTLMATDGLNHKAIGKAVLHQSQGLVGQVGVREEPLNLENASSHPDYFFLKNTGEELFRSFLGVPVIHHRKTLGVLVVQQEQERRFNENDEAFLITISAQLAAVLAHAKATGDLGDVSKKRKKKTLARFRGIAGASGIAIGKAIIVYPPADLNSITDEPQKESIAVEMERFDKALEASKADVRIMRKQIACLVESKEQALFDAYLTILQDQTFVEEIVELIRAGSGAQWALRKRIDTHIKTFESMKDSYLKERASDFRDLGRLILSNMQQQVRSKIDYPKNAIVVAEELTPTLLAEIPQDKLAGLISVKGSRHSHAAILASAMNIPTVVGAVNLPYSKLGGKEVIVDGNEGTVYTNPTGALKKRFRALIASDKQQDAKLLTLKNEACLTTDGHQLSLCVNIGLICEVSRSLDRGAEGVGLYRTELPFITRERFPTETEQAQIYQAQLKAFHPLPVTMRTLDIGGDKSLSYFPINEENPFLGWRGIRVTLDHPEIFLVQIRAMLRASKNLNNLRIMLPMITSCGEIKDSLALIKRAYQEIISEGLAIQMPQIGVMVEVPAAVYQARKFCQYVDFVSVGSNDLTQYLLAVDRNNPQVANLYSSFHPAVLHALQLIVKAAQSKGKPVSICGEMAGDPVSAVLLVAMGFDVLSMNTSNLLKVKWVLNQISLQKAKEIFAEVSLYTDPEKIQKRLVGFLKQQGIDYQFSQPKEQIEGADN